MLHVAELQCKRQAEKEIQGCVQEEKKSGIFKMQPSNWYSSPLNASAWSSVNCTGCLKKQFCLECGEGKHAGAAVCVILSCVPEMTSDFNQMLVF